MSVLHQSSGGIGKSIPSAHEISLGPPGPSLLLVEHRYNPTLHTLKGLLFLDAAMMSLHLAQAEAACLLPPSSPKVLSCQRYPNCAIG